MNDNNTVSNRISLSPGKVALVLGIMASCLIFASLAGQLVPYFTDRGHPVYFLSVDEERSLPTFFSVLLIVAAAFLLAVIAVFKKAQGAAHALYWLVLTAGFLFMALDEATSLHEKLQGPMSRLMGQDRPSIFHFAWVVPGITFVIVMGLFFLRFLMRLPVKTRRLFLAAACVYLGGAIVLELAGGHYAASQGIHSWAFIVISSVEESFEMAGMIIFIFALLGYMAETFDEVRFGFNPRERVQERWSADLKESPVSLNNPVVSARRRRPEIAAEPVTSNLREPAVTP